MVGYYYKTGAEIHEIICFMEEKLKLSCVTSPSSLKTGQTYGWKPYRFSFFLNAQNKFVYLIEPLANDETDYEQLAKRCQSKEEKEMTKEEALKKIEELKAFVEKLDEEIPEMPRHGNHSIHIVVPDKPHNPYISWDRSFENEESSDLYSILSFELAQLIYAREYLKVDGEKLLRARKHGDMVFKVIFDVTECVYVTINVFCSQSIDENERIWCFKDEQDALRVCDYLNKYVKDIKKNMF